MLLAAFALTPAATAFPSYDVPSGLGNAHIGFMEGDVLFDSPDTDEWAAVTPNFTLRDGDRLWVGEDSRMELIFRGGPNAWVNYKSGLDILRMDVGLGGTGDTYHVSLPFGEATFRVGNFRELGSVFQVDTPSASVRAYGAARFRVIAMSDSSTQVGVQEGTVEVETDDGIITVREGDLLEVTARGRPFISGLPRADSWDKWVGSRMGRYTRGYDSDRYLPEDIRYYSYEFEGNGRWESYPEYGFVWVPRVDPLWSPYSNGRWIWSGGQYVWLSYDPWYTPFHFGRWAWTARLGWYWVPPGSRSAYWSPGYVGWSYSHDDVYWVPLAPGEIYYGHGNYGRNSVNIINIKTYNITNVYVNSRAHRGVVGSRRNDFLEGRHKRVDVSERDNPFVHRDRKGHRLIGRQPVEELRPAKRTWMPEPDRKVSERMRPPDWVGDNAERIRKERAVARKTGESAFGGADRPRRIKDVTRDRVPESAASGQEMRRERDSGGTSGPVRTPDRPKTLEEQGKDDLEREQGRSREDRDRRDRRDDGRVEQPGNGERDGRTRSQAPAPDTVRRGVTEPERQPDRPGRGGREQGIEGTGAAAGTVITPQAPGTLDEQGREGLEREQGRVREEREQERIRREERDRRDDGRTEQPRTEQPRVREPGVEERNTRQQDVVKPRADEAPAARQPGALGGGNGFGGAPETVPEFRGPMTFEEQGREAVEREQRRERETRESGRKPEPAPRTRVQEPASPADGAPFSGVTSGGKTEDGSKDTGREKRRDRRDRRD
ncbi:MAG: FecR domain-containing protein [Nitrospirae bacterium]|nr:FecR domain-containing protein [Nitrospirota bacterium]MBI5695280.1 FecR domain-containing protein [Nitrospirota bacterium]